jgi:hypothetical protein
MKILPVTFTADSSKAMLSHLRSMPDIDKEQVLHHSRGIEFCLYNSFSSIIVIKALIVEFNFLVLLHISQIVVATPKKLRKILVLDNNNRD